MKNRLPLLLLATFAVTGMCASAMGQQMGPGAGDQGETTLIHRPTPKPGSSAAPAAPGVKKPLTATLSKDSTGKESLTAFASSDPTIYCVWKAETGTKGEKVRIAWYSDGEKGKKLTENVQVIPGTGSISGSAHIEKPAGGFPVGKYRADVYDDAKLARSLKFTITK